MKRMPVLTLLAVVASMSATLVSPTSASDPTKAKPMDWPHWRGPEMNGISREKGLPESWSPDGENLLWMNKELATRSTPIVLNGKLYCMARLNPGSESEGEKVICADAATGKIVWENKFNVYLSDVPDARVGWSSVTGDTETGNIFALGVCGYFQCMDGETGETKWSHSLCEEFGLLSTYGGRTNFPIVHGDLVIISSIIIGWGDQAKPAHRFIAFDKRNGQPVWFNGTRPLPYDTTYSSPVLTRVNGMNLLVFGSGDGGVHAFQPETGLPVWKYNVSRRGINTTPIISGNYVVAGHSEENIGSTQMGALFALKLDGKGDITKTGEHWRNKEMYVGKASPLVIGDRIYAIEDKGNFLVVDLKTGKQIDRKKIGRQGRASAVYGDGKIYCCEANGNWFIFKITDDGLERIHQERIDAEVSGSLIISHGRIYLPTSEGMYCIADKSKKPAVDPRPEVVAEAPVNEDMTPAHVQVVPCESLLRGGVQSQRQLHVVRLYNSKGQYLKTCKSGEVEFSIEGAGSIDADGRYSCPKESNHEAVTVTAKVGDITGTARIRVIPDFPWTFDFNDGKIPVTWVGARYRHIAIDFDLYKKLEQDSETLSRLYIFLRSGYVNFNTQVQVFDNTTPAQKWSGFLHFTRLTEAVRTIDDAKATVDPLLEALKKEGAIAEWTWEKVGDAGIRLKVTRGEDKVTGNGVMTKITTIPKGARSQGWMGRPVYSNYTIQADIYAAQRNSKQGDAGVIGQRYRMDLMGATQELKIISWISHEEKFKTVPFEWKPNTWYTLKLQTGIEKHKDAPTLAVLSGKVWERGTEEPKEWTIQWKDEPGNVVGSPGLFGNAKDAEVFFDNIKVTAN
jgi:outer membrane protein assembly factor BamB